MVVALNFSNHFMEYAEVDVTKESQKKKKFTIQGESQHVSVQCHQRRK